MDHSSPPPAPATCRYTTRTSALEADTFSAAKRRLIERGQHFAGGSAAGGVQGCLVRQLGMQQRCSHTCTRTQLPSVPLALLVPQHLCLLPPSHAETSKRARATIAELGERFIGKGSTVLAHGHSRVAIAILRRAAMAVSAAYEWSWADLAGWGGCRGGRSADGAVPGARAHSRAAIAILRQAATRGLAGGVAGVPRQQRWGAGKAPCLLLHAHQPAALGCLLVSNHCCRASSLA